MKVINNGPGNTNYTKQPTFEYNNSIDIEIRGNSSQAYPQKQYGFELKIHDSLVNKDAVYDKYGIVTNTFDEMNELSVAIIVVGHRLYQELGLTQLLTRFQGKKIVMDIPNLFALERATHSDLIYWSL